MIRYVLPALIMSLAIGAYAEAVTDENSVPSWIKQTAKYWVEGYVSDQEFISALQYLVNEGVLVLPSETPSEHMDTPLPSASVEPSTQVHPDAVRGTITRIIDGDTLLFDSVKYRLSLIDTPELGEDGFWEATNALKWLCPPGSVAYMDDDSIQMFDKYGRHLGTVWCEGNDYATTAGEWLHENGYLEKFYTDFCDTTQAATLEWAKITGTWMYYDACNDAL